MKNYPIQTSSGPFRKFLFALAAVAAFTGFAAIASAGMSFTDWATSHGLSGDDALPTGNPDGDPYINALEYAFGSDPKLPNQIVENGPSFVVISNQLTFAYRVSTQAMGVATYRVVQTTNLENPEWLEVVGAPIVTQPSPDLYLYHQPVDTNAPKRFFRVEVTVPYTPVFSVQVLVGTGVGTNQWDGLPIISQVWIRQQSPDIAVYSTNNNVITTNNVPNLSKYPEVVGTSLFAATSDLLNDANTSGNRLRRRSWVGWFGWANGTPPPGLSPGYPTTGTYDTNSPWDFFSFQFPSKSPNPPHDGAWNPVRLDQQPLYLNPFRVNYAWPPGQFGYVSQPLMPFVPQTGYWASKRIVRGPNLSFANPFFVQYADKITTGDTPDVWRDSWFYMRTRPLETLLVLPGNLKPDQLLQNGAWNFNGTNYDPFPYPMWVTNLPAKDQTPFAIQVDRMGDWDADLIWEGTHSGAVGYATNRYRRTAFNQPGQGNYLKMTVAQGSPFIWGETCGNRYVNFYNLIRQNLTNSIANNSGTDAKMVPGGPWPVPGVSGVSYVLFYGDQNNPNQWYQEAPPWYYNATNGAPGGFNPPGKQHNYTYTALFYRTNSVQPVSLGTGGTGSTKNNGTDAQGNPYFYLEFKNSAKNWFVVGSVPVMSYYHTGVTVDSEAVRIAGARDWADEMGKFAFNFVTGTKITYASSNMYLVTTTYTNTVRNPYVAAGDSGASGMTKNNSQTIMALLPHHYQRFTLGPDLTQKSKPSVLWNPLIDYGTDFPENHAPPNANKNDPTSTSRWGYWGPRGTMKAIVTARFITQYPFQNFLPVMPPAQLSSNYTETGIQVLRITDVGTGYHAISNAAPHVSIHMPNPTNSSDATFEALLEPHTGRIMQVNVGNPGSGYPDGNPPDTNLVYLTIDPPQIPADKGGRQAAARVQIGGGKVLAVFMDDKGAGYESTISVTQSNVTTDAPIIQPPFDASGNLALGAATIYTAGAGFDFSNTNNPPIINVIGTGTGAKAEILKAGQLVGISVGSAGGFTSAGSYPGTGDEAADAARIQVHIPPPAPGLPAQTARVTHVLESATNWGGTAMINRGQYQSQPDAYFVDDNGVVNIPATNMNFAAGTVLNVTPPAGGFKISTPRSVVFTNGNPTVQAEAIIYPQCFVQTVELTPPLVGGYQSDPEISFSGGEILTSNITLPTFDFTIMPNGGITNLHVVNGGSGILIGGTGNIVGGQGFDAMIYPVLDTHGGFSVIKVLRPGSNYPTNVFTMIQTKTGGGAQLSVVVKNGQIAAVNVLSAGQGYTNSDVVFLTSLEGGEPNVYPPKGMVANFNFGVDGSGHVVNPMLTPGKTGQNYIPGTENTNTAASPAAQVLLSPPFSAAVPSAEASGYIAETVKPSLSVDQVLYDNLICEYQTEASDAQKPFGGAFGGLSGPDGYGLGNQLSASAKFISVLYNYQQHYASLGLDQPQVSPSGFAFNAGNVPASVYEFPIYRVHQPMFTLSGALETSVQSLQRTLSLFHQDPPYHNNPETNNWQMDYFSAYDTKAGRVVINPSGTIPVQGVVSTTMNPPPISAQENAGKTGLKTWQPGMLWSGFGVSDQWNDQHYFYGYYLGTAGLMAILDQSWKTNIVSKPGSLWADPGQMGTGIDQWLMTLAYDPDNVPLVNSLYRKPELTYQKFAFFDQWSGHGWATGVSPGRAGDIEDGKYGALVPWSIWLSHGTGSSPYDDENENSIWEGLQPWSAIMLWGGGTDRRPLVDLGMYLLATGNAAGDMYFHDKNYNLPNTSSNKFSWVPVTTVNSSQVVMNGGNNRTPANSGFVETTAPAFYTAPDAFGGKGSAGTSILEKGSPSLNNFFYAFPTGSKFIQSFPPAPWTLGMTRNSDYMKRWAGSMMRPEWQEARNSSLFQAANWLSMSMACAVSGVPYNPGDTPYPTNSMVLNSNAPQPYVGRLWSSWVTLNAAAGADAARQPTFTGIDVLNFLHTLDVYGSPDWTYIGKATSGTGTPDNNAIVFMAAFSKQINATTVRTTFVAFNPGWQTRHASFYRLAVTGAIGTSPVVPEMAIAAKRMTVVTHDFTVN